jgi:hypothetical protein
MRLQRKLGGQVRLEQGRRRKKISDEIELIAVAIRGGAASAVVVVRRCSWRLFAKEILS